MDTQTHASDDYFISLVHCVHLKEIITYVQIW